ncbi:MAG: right-handed parallel beta-helix repeat-containing protein [Lachnospiraceae bacterium]|nr:right-handed parallel beta-helix repeat-containing protein [Lachnospiraceae bacterium]
MKLRIELNKRNLISTFIIFCFISFTCMVATRDTKTIIDDIIPLAGGNVEAMFYVESSDGGSTTCIGDGLINSTQDISNNESEVEHSIVSSPDYSAVVGNELRIAWHTIKHEDGEYRVIGKLTSADKSTDSDTAISVSTFADLQSITAAEGTTVSTKGFYAENDGGGAEYIISSSADTLNIPNVSAQISNGLYANLVYSSSINVRQVGAHGDGVTDDTSLFASVMSKAPNNNVYIPAGSYSLSETVFIPSGTIITGDGKSSIIIACTGFARGDDLLKINNATDITLSGISISGDIASNSKLLGHNDIDGIHLLDIWNSNKINIKNCSFIDNVYAGVRFIGDCSDISVNSTEFNNIDCGLVHLGSGALTNFVVENCVFDGHKNSESISLFGTGTYTNIIIDNNIIKNKTKGHAIYSAHGTTNGIYITNNTLLDDCVGIYLKNANDVLIDNNVIDFSNCITMNNGKGINITSCANVTLSNNSICKTSQQGLYINGCTNVSATNNIVADCGYVNNDFHAVDLRESCSNVILESNQIIRNDDTLSPYSFVAHCSGSVTIKNNVFENTKALLAKDSSNLIMSGNGVVVNNQGSNNSITD